MGEMKRYCAIIRELRRNRKGLSLRIYFEPPGRRPRAYYYRLLGGGLRLILYLGSEPRLGLSRLREVLCCSVDMSRARGFSVGAVYLLLLVAIAYAALRGGLREGGVGGLLSLVGFLGFVLSAVEARNYSRGRALFEACMLASSRLRLGLGSVFSLAEAVERIASYGISCRERGGKCSGVIATSLGRFRVVVDKYGVRASKI